MAQSPFGLFCFTALFLLTCGVGGFEEMDTNGDGRLDRSEVRALLGNALDNAKLAPELQNDGMPIALLMNDFREMAKRDPDSAKKLAPNGEEALEKEMASFDGNGDGLLNFEEYADYTVNTYFKLYDADGDGFLSLEEGMAAIH